MVIVGYWPVRGDNSSRRVSNKVIDINIFLLSKAAGGRTVFSAFIRYSNGIIIDTQFLNAAL